MRLLRPRTLSGGVSFAATKAATMAVPIETLSPRETLRVPLWVPPYSADGDALQCAENESDAAGRSTGPRMELLVQNGDHGTAGQLVARARSGVPAWARVFAPISGVIGEPVWVESAFGFSIPAIELKPHGEPSDGGLSPAQAGRPPPEALLDRLAAWGIAVDPDSSRTPGGTPLEYLIVNGLETAPYATARTRTLLEHAPALIDAAGRAGEALGVPEVHFVVDRTMSKLAGVLRCQARGTPVTIVPLPNSYPQSHPRLLFRAVTGRNLPPDRTTRDGGAWIIGTCELWDIQRALTGGGPPVFQTLTVAGDAVQRPGNYRVPLGTSVGAILGRVGLRVAPARIVLGNTLTGTAVRSPDAVIVRGVEGLYAWSPAAVPDRDPTGCLRCGFCIEICPVGIDPRGVFHAVELGRWADVPAWAPQVCLDCGLCDYVCPAALPLLQALRGAHEHNRGEHGP